MYDLNPDDTIEIKEAPPKQVLDVFGGDMTLDIFRRSFATINKDYLVYVPPIKPINILIEEINTESNNDNERKYVLKRKKPLLAKKRSIIATMNMGKKNNGD